jgi:CheY-like chemotaxis protein
VFELFSQERQEIDRSQGGLGLGLAIVKSLIEAHGGSVQAHSAGKGLGAEFVVELPLAEQRAEEVTPAPAKVEQRAAAGAGLRILIVDDNADAAELLGEWLRTLGHTTRIAFDGPRALESAAQFQPHLALLDLGLPVMDGFEVARALKEVRGLGAISLIAVTGYGQELDRQRTRAAGFEEHLVKPIDLERLRDWLRERRQPAAAAEGSPAQSCS